MDKNQREQLEEEFRKEEKYFKENPRRKYITAKYYEKFERDGWEFEKRCKFNIFINKDSGKCKHLLRPDECRCCLYHCKNEYIVGDMDSSNDYIIVCQGFIHGPGKWYSKKYRRRRKKIEILSGYCNECNKRDKCRFICDRVKTYLKNIGVYAEINGKVFLPDNEKLASHLINWRDKENALIAPEDEEHDNTKLDILFVRPYKRKGPSNLIINEPPIRAIVSWPDMKNFTLEQYSHPLLTDRENKSRWLYDCEGLEHRDIAAILTADILEKTILEGGKAKEITPTNQRQIYSRTNKKLKAVGFPFLEKRKSLIVFNPIKGIYMNHNFILKDYGDINLKTLGLNFAGKRTREIINQRKNLFRRARQGNIIFQNFLYKILGLIHIYSRVEIKDYYRKMTTTWNDFIKWRKEKNVTYSLYIEGGNDDELCFIETNERDWNDPIRPWGEDRDSSDQDFPDRNGGLESNR